MTDNRTSVDGHELNQSLSSLHIHQNPLHYVVSPSSSSSWVGGLQQAWLLHLLRFLMQPYWSISDGGPKTVSKSKTVFPLIFTPRFRTCIVSTVFFIGWWKHPGRDDAKLVLVSCLISTASCTFTFVSETTFPFTMLYSERDWCVSGCGCFRSSVKIRSQ